MKLWGLRHRRYVFLKHYWACYGGLHSPRTLTYWAMRARLDAIWRGKG